MPNNGNDEQEKGASLDFSKLESLRRLCTEIQQYQVVSLDYFKHGLGFQHVLGSNKVSISSSATCVLSLVATGNWKATKADTKALLTQLLARDASAGLPVNNSFTAAWILEAVTALEEYSDPLDASDRELVTKKEEILQTAIKEGGGAVSISQYP